MSSTGYGIILHRHSPTGQPDIGVVRVFFQIHGLASADSRASIHLCESTSSNWRDHPCPWSSCERRFPIISIGPLMRRTETAGPHN
jgi:hypothetical protein